jgi:hypothetical protein
MRSLLSGSGMGRGAMIVALAALVVGLGGGAYAAKKIKLKNNSVTTPKIRDGAVTSPKLGDGAVTSPKLGDGAVTAPKLGAGAISSQVSIIGKQPGDVLSNVPGGQSRAGTITCPSGYQAIAGQAALVSPSDSVNDMGMISSRRDDTDPAVWLIRMGNTDASAHTWLLYATCIKIG